MLDIVKVYQALGGAPALNVREMTQHIVVPVLGTEFHSAVMFDDEKEYEAMRLAVREEYGVPSLQNGWKRLYRSVSGQVEALLSPDGKVIDASVLRQCGIVGAYFIQAAL